MIDAPPQAIEAEQSVLGALMLNQSVVVDVAGILAPDDLYRPSHQAVYDVILTLYGRDEPVDTITVHAELARRGDLAKAGGAAYLHDLIAGVPTAVNAVHYAQIVADKATQRRLLMAGQRIVQRAAAGDVEPEQLLAWAGEQVAAVRDERAGVEVLTTGWDEFLRASGVAPPPVIPGLLGEGDRIILTGGGGWGKSTLLRQVMVCGAAGCPPFDYQTEDPFEPVRTMMFDCENPNYKAKDALWKMITGLSNMGLDPRPNLTLRRLGGRTFDLLNPANARSLLRTVEHDKPRLLYIGPVYKLHNADPDKEETVKKITGVLDRIRDMGVAVITEAHANKAWKSGGSMSPSGSGMWEWWPEFGVGMRPDPDTDEIVRRTKLERWRLDRDESSWPLYVQSSMDPVLPWCRAPFMPEPDQITASGKDLGHRDF